MEEYKKILQKKGQKSLCSTQNYFIKSLPLHLLLGPVEIIVAYQGDVWRVWTSFSSQK